MSTAWFDNDQGRMSPDELQTVVFPTSRLGRRGLEEGPVRDFLAGVHGEFVRLLNERTSLWQEVQRLRRRIIAGQTDGEGGGEDSVLFGAQDAHVHAVRILSTAQVTAEKYVADARDYSSRLTKETRHRRDEIMTQARQHSDRIMQEAQAEARAAAVSALNMDQPHSEKEWHAAQAELAYLRTYSGVYRAHLKAYTEGILRGIEEWERKETASLADAAQRQPNPGPPPVTPPVPPPANGRGPAGSHSHGTGNANGHARGNGNGSAYLRH